MNGAGTVTPLQLWYGRLDALLDLARDQLDESAYDVFVDLVFRRVVHEAVAVGLDSWREEAT